jgi:hypothetical protein
MARRSKSQLAAQRNMRIMLTILALLIVGSMVLSLVQAVTVSPVVPMSTPAIIRTLVPLTP